jgi:two-component system nitrogen regulation response regulator GlnG
VIDDEPNIVFSIKECLGSDELEVISAGTAREGVALVASAKPDAVICDVRLPDMSGLDAYDAIAKLDSRLPVIVITAFASTETAIEAMRRGAFEYLIKPVELDQLAAVVDKAIEISRLNRVPALIDDDATDLAADRIVGQSPVMQDVYKAIGRVAPTDSTVLILGESGAGKELVARAIYHYSRRSKSPFLAINCAALPEALLESELFGHESGAFTGAHHRRIGKFEQAHGGTILLDEIGDMTLAAQAKVLRLLQDQVFQRLGGTETISTNVRLLAATNHDLGSLIAAGKFREDLFYRLNSFTIRVPSLRERREDIPLLVNHFIKRFNREMHRSVRAITDDAIRLCQNHDWRGNIRELEGAIRHAMVHSAGDVITPDSLPGRCGGRETPVAVAATNQSDETDLVALVRQLLAEGRNDVYQQIAAHVDRVVLAEVLRQMDGKQMKACRRLGIARMTLRNKLRACGLLAATAGDSEADETSD